MARFILREIGRERGARGAVRPKRCREARGTFPYSTAMIANR